MEKFEVKGDNGFIKIEIVEVFGFPNQTSHFGGYECKSEIEVQIPNYQAKGNLFTTTGEIYRFYEDLRKCNDELNGEVAYISYEGNLELKVKYDELGQVGISGKFQEYFSVENCLFFEIDSDQSYMKYVIDELELIVAKYGNDLGISKKN